MCRRQPKKGAGSTTAAAPKGRSFGRLPPCEAEAPSWDERPHNAEPSLPPSRSTSIAATAAMALRHRAAFVPFAVSPPSGSSESGPGRERARAMASLGRSYGTSKRGVNDERSDETGRRCRIVVVVT